MAIAKLEVNDIVCVEASASGLTLIHFKGGRYIETTMEDAMALQKLLADKLQKVLSVYGDPPQPDQPIRTIN